MGSSDYRGGRAPVRSASELALLLPVPIMMIVDGFAEVVFPNTDRSNPSPYVAIMPTREKKSYPSAVGFPVYVHWKQWEEIFVPLLLEDPRVAGWRGTIRELGEATTLMNNIVGPTGEIVFSLGLQFGLSAPAKVSLGKLYACDPFDSDRYGGKTGSYLNELMGMIYEAATEAGY